MPVIVNLFGTVTRVAAGFGVQRNRLGELGDALAALRNPRPFNGVRDALKRWVPGATLVSLAVEQDGPALTLRVRVRERETSAAVAVSIER